MFDSVYPVDCTCLETSTMNYIWCFIFASLVAAENGPVDQINDILGDPALDKATPQEWIHQLVKLIRGHSFPTAIASNISDQCIQDSLHYVHSYYNLEAWALKMYESTGEYPDGLIGSLQYNAVGLFDECLSVRAVNATFTGQYCTVFFLAKQLQEGDLMDDETPIESAQDRRITLVTVYRIAQWLGAVFEGDIRQLQQPKTAERLDEFTYGPSMGLCIPSSCSAIDLRVAVAQLVGKYAIGNQSIVTTSGADFCFVERDGAPDFNAADIAFLAVASLIGALVLTATVHESWRIYRHRPIDSKDWWPVRAWHCFSALNNGRKLLSTTTSSSDNLGCVHGFRFLSTTWVILGHTWVQEQFTANYTFYKMVQDAYTWQMQVITNATVSVDSFLVLSGLLVSYTLLKELDRSKGRFNLLLFYVHRYLRLTPVYAFLIGFTATVYVYLGDGPNWLPIEYISIQCRNGWWYNLLYINNFLPANPELLDHACKVESWYLGVDMQLFLVSPLLIYPLWRWKKVGLIWLAFVTLALLVTNVVIHIVYYLGPYIPTRSIPPILGSQPMNELLLTRADQRTSNDWPDIYNTPWFRALPYLVGVFTGWLLRQDKKSPIKLPKIAVLAGWTVAIATGSAVIYGLTAYVKPGSEFPAAAQQSYGSMFRLAWAVAVAWVIFACCTGYGGFVNNILSWRGFVPLSRLGYCTYLIHLLYIGVYYYHVRKPRYYTVFEVVNAYLGIVTASFGLAFLVSVSVEASFLNLEKLVFQPLVGRNEQRPTSKGPQATDQLNVIDGSPISNGPVESTRIKHEGHECT